MNERKFWDQEALPSTGERIMAEKTLERLKELTKKCQRELQELGSNTESGQQRAQIHDSSTLEEYKNELRGRIRMIGNLSNTLLIAPRQAVDYIFLGNRVKVLIEGESSPETFTILGPDDSGSIVEELAPGTVVISYKSPIGAAIINKKVNEKVYYKVNNKNIGVEILSIESGEF